MNMWTNLEQIDKDIRELHETLGRLEGENAVLQDVKRKAGLKSGGAGKSRNQFGISEEGLVADDYIVEERVEVRNWDMWKSRPLLIVKEERFSDDVLIPRMYPLIVKDEDAFVKVEKKDKVESVVEEVKVAKVDLKSTSQTDLIPEVKIKSEPVVIESRVIEKVDATKTAFTYGSIKPATLDSTIPEIKEKTASMPITTQGFQKINPPLQFTFANIPPVSLASTRIIESKTSTLPLIVKKEMKPTLPLEVNTGQIISQRKDSRPTTSDSPVPKSEQDSFVEEVQIKLKNVVTESDIEDEKSETDGSVKSETFGGRIESDSEEMNEEINESESESDDDDEEKLDSEKNDSFVNVNDVEEVVEEDNASATSYESHDANNIISDDAFIKVYFFMDSIMIKGRISE